MTEKMGPSRSYKLINVEVEEIIEEILEEKSILQLKLEVSTTLFLKRIVRRTFKTKVKNNPFTF